MTPAQQFYGAIEPGTAGELAIILAGAFGLLWLQLIAVRWILQTIKNYLDRDQDVEL